MTTDGGAGLDSTGKKDASESSHLYVSRPSAVSLQLLTMRIPVQGTFLPADRAADLDSMGRHEELLEAGRQIRKRTADLKSCNATLEGLGHRRSIDRQRSISQAEQHMFDFDRIVRVTSHITCLLHADCKLKACLGSTRKTTSCAAEEQVKTGERILWA